ncbi:hypothetical protein C6Y14_42440 [Streptomyces dioscori]|uniref:Uncharacterized protein n=1 Tax=Streptomyces dioscori TaxID=2109333 RepID=A0A2P8PTS8_9ACTN|nr:hypothetical protein C6Y14_42440 [Streptomyces dioscori]
MTQVSGVCGTGRIQEEGGGPTRPRGRRPRAGDRGRRPVSRGRAAVPRGAFREGPGTSGLPALSRRERARASGAGTRFTRGARRAIPCRTVPPVMS